jgi:hypothetical protein
LLDFGSHSGEILSHFRFFLVATVLGPRITPGRVTGPVFPSVLPSSLMKLRL